MTQTQSWSTPSRERRGRRRWREVGHSWRCRQHLSPPGGKTDIRGQNVFPRFDRSCYRITRYRDRDQPSYNSIQSSLKIEFISISRSINRDNSISRPIVIGSEAGTCEIWLKPISVMQSSASDFRQFGLILYQKLKLNMNVLYYENFDC